MKNRKATVVSVAAVAKKFDVIEMTAADLQNIFAHRKTVKVLLPKKPDFPKVEKLGFSPRENNYAVSFTAAAGETTFVLKNDPNHINDVKVCWEDANDKVHTRTIRASVMYTTACRIHEAAQRAVRPQARRYKGATPTVKQSEICSAYRAELQRITGIHKGFEALWKAMLLVLTEGNDWTANTSWFHRRMADTVLKQNNRARKNAYGSQSQERR